MPEILVTPHAIENYIIRVRAGLSNERAKEEIANALRAPLFRLDISTGTLWGCLNRAGYPFLALTDPADEGSPFLLVRTAGPRWYWHEARPYWRVYNQGTRRRYRVHRDDRLVRSG